LNVALLTVLWWSAKAFVTLSLKIQGHCFSTDFYLTPLGGCDVVLSVDWLHTLGPILWDFNLMTMKFGQEPHSTLQHGLTPSGLTLEDGATFLRSTPSQNKGFMLQLWSQPPSCSATTSQESL